MAAKAAKNSETVWYIVDKGDERSLIEGDFNDIDNAYGVGPTLKAAIESAIDLNDVSENQELVAVEMTIGKPVALNVETGVRISPK